MAPHSALDRWQETHGAESAARWEFEQVIETVQESGLDIEVVVEVGCHAGASLAVWIEEFDPVLALGIELEYSERTLAGLRPLVDSGKAVIFFGDSNATDTWVALRAFLNGVPIDFLYIDGDHDVIPTSIDFALYGSLVRPGGFVCLDDTKREDGPQHVRESLPDGLTFEAPGDSTGKYLLRKPD